VLGSRRKTPSTKCPCLEPTHGGIYSFNLKSSIVRPGRLTKDVPLIGAAETTVEARRGVCGDRSLNG
jgi:hypothetical protein